MKEIREQEERLQFEKFDNETAQEIGCMLVAMARERGHAVTKKMLVWQERLQCQVLHQKKIKD